jgi:hypothetical protein
MGWDGSALVGLMATGACALGPENDVFVARSTP